MLFDFADIESWDPDGNYFGDKLVNDNCDYDSDGNGTRDKNWAIDWQNAHTVNVDWYNCSSAHSQPLNANRKAYAAWTLFAQIVTTNRTPGDANGDGKVDLQDLSVLASHYNQSGLTGNTWTKGDFNDDKAVNLQDLSILAGKYGTGGGSGK